MRSLHKAEERLGKGLPPQNIALERILGSDDHIRNSHAQGAGPPVRGCAQIRLFFERRPVFCFARVSTTC